MCAQFVGRHFIRPDEVANVSPVLKNAIANVSRQKTEKLAELMPGRRPKNASGVSILSCPKCTQTFSVHLFVLKNHIVIKIDFYEVTALGY